MAHEGIVQARHLGDSVAALYGRATYDSSASAPPVTMIASRN
jgi:hypothetical protein